MAFNIAFGTKKRTDGWYVEASVPIPVDGEWVQSGYESGPFKTEDEAVIKCDDAYKQIVEKYKEIGTTFKVN